jgi:hypothetical protein
LNKTVLVVLIAVFSVCTFSGCKSETIQTSGAIAPLPDDQYAALVEKYTARTSRYAGFYATFQADLTMMSNEFKAAELKQRGAFMMWDERQYQQEREKAVQEAAAYAKFFMRFYSPEKDYDDFVKGNSIWKVYLDYNGTRFEGKVKKIPSKLIELQTLYPYFDRFSTPYEITFPVPMSTIETGTFKVVLSSSLGKAEFLFPVKR